MLSALSNVTLVCDGATAHTRRSTSKPMSFDTMLETLVAPSSGLAPRHPAGKSTHKARGWRFIPRPG